VVVSHKVLADTLRRSERDGLIRRHLDSGRIDTANVSRSQISADPLESLSPRSGDGLTPTGTRSKRRSEVGLAEPRFDGTPD